MRRWIWRAGLGCGIGGLIAVGLLATPHGTAAAACSETWVGGVDTNFSTAGNWLPAVVPGAADDACITATTTTMPRAAADTYTVVVNGGRAVRSLTIGGPNGTQTVLIPSGVQLSLSAASDIGTNGVVTMGDGVNGDSNLCHLNTVTGGGGTRILQVNLTNGPAGTLDVAGPTTQDSGGGATTTINDGTVLIAAAGRRCRTA